MSVFLSDVSWVSPSSSRVFATACWCCALRLSCSCSADFMLERLKQSPQYQTIINVVCQQTYIMSFSMALFVIDGLMVSKTTDDISWLSFIYSHHWIKSVIIKDDQWSLVLIILMNPLIFPSEIPRGGAGEKHRSKLLVPTGDVFLQGLNESTELWLLLLFISWLLVDDEFGDYTYY